MSEFFKALEQAERDRLRQDESDAATAPPEAVTPPVQSPPAALSPIAAEPLASKPGAPRPTGPVETKAVASKPTVPPVAAKPADRKPGIPGPVIAKAAAPSKPVTEEPGVAKSAVAPVKPETVLPKPPSMPATPDPAKGSRMPEPAKVRSSNIPEAPSPANVYRPSLRAPQRTGLLGRRSKRHPLLIALTDPNSIEADAYRTVRANIELMANGHPFRHIAITSAAGGDGKSTTAANLAVVSAHAGRRVCLVDTDFRRPTVHEIFGLPNVDGLALGLERGTPLHALAKQTDIENLSVVVAGRGADESFHGVLTAQRLQKILRDSDPVFDLVLFDSPPVTSVADALSVTAVCDGVILVVRAGSISFSVLKRAVAQVTQVKGRVLGVLLNQVDLQAVDSDSYRYYRAYHTTRPSAQENT